TLLRTDQWRAAAAALAFGCWAFVAALASPERVSAIWGIFQLGTGLVFVLALFGSWGIGVLSLENGKALIERALLMAVCANALLAVAQMSTDLSALHLGLFDGRATGFYGNPVYLAALLIAGFW